jgi:hypothetical protein
MASPRGDHSPAFALIRDRIVALDEPERARLAGLFGAMAEKKGKLGPAVRGALRAIAELDDDDLERLVGWFGRYVNRWGQMPRSVGMGRESGAYADRDADRKN